MAESAIKLKCGELFWNEEPRLLMAFDAQSGKKLWAKLTKVAPLTLAADTSQVYFHDGQKVVSVDQRSGELAWESEKCYPSPSIHF